MNYGTVLVLVIWFSYNRNNISSFTSQRTCQEMRKDGRGIEIAESFIVILATTWNETTW